MTQEEKERSYAHYEQYRNNRARYEAPAGAVMFIAIIGGFWVLFKTGFSFNAFFLFLIAVVFGVNILYCLSMRNRKQDIVDESVHLDNKIMILDKEDNSMPKKWTETGTVNKNNQRNNGRTDEPGTDNAQWFYEMECLNCGHKYKANGSDIWQRKCPSCQGGKA
ncbi:MAG: hypothetical protein K6G05_04130 [Lachnospiraceae bacterium]|nr:hypothetical protein [Lachnospiraceae bacterium]